MKALPLVTVAALALFSGCVSVPITPANVATSPVPAPLRHETMDRGNEAVQWCNEFQLTHSWCRAGTVSFTKSVAYYAECVFLFRYSNHSMERLANKTSGEFADFVMRRGGMHAN